MKEERPRNRKRENEEWKRGKERKGTNDRKKQFKEERKE
jgi:hypothetical protein